MASDSYKLDYDKVFGSGNKKLVLGIILAIVIYGVWQGYGGESALPFDSKQSDAVAQQTYAEMCSKFSVIEGEVSCEKAVNIALERFSGSIAKITQAQIGARPQAGAESVLRDVWSIEIDLLSPYKLTNGKTASTIAVQVDRRDKQILAFKVV